MNFLEARRVVQEFPGGPRFPLLFGMSGTGEPLAIYLRAAGARRGLEVVPRFLPFNTLGQTLLQAASPEESELFLLFPWDFDAQLDWRSGLPAARAEPEAALQRASALLARIAQRPAAHCLYVPAPIPPVFADPAVAASVGQLLAARVIDAGARLLSPSVFSLRGHFSSGMPLAGTALGEVASRAVELAAAPRREPAKLLVTDLDNTMWRGVIAEDGPAGIKFTAEGAGYAHFVYQTHLQRLKAEGVLLAAVSRNDRDVAIGPLRDGAMVLGEPDFVAVVASYHAKSAQIRELAAQLNLGLQSVVFVDDNPIELEEVSRALPEVQCLRFPEHEDGLPELLDELATRFGRSEVTAEDRDRTAMYRRRLEGLVPREASGADLVAFLRDLRMRLILHDRSTGDRTRAVQLINKTNQFNLNGHRVTDEEVGAILASGGRLLAATLEDRAGSHGEILSCLVDRGGTIRSLVLSCRVFQRRVEHAFSSWLAGQPFPPTRFDFAPTERNEPFRLFLGDPSFGPAVEGAVLWDTSTFARDHAGDLSLFDLVPPGRS